MAVSPLRMLTGWSCFRKISRASGFRFGKTVTYVTKSGKTLDEATIKTRIKIGLPVHVHFTGEGENLVVDD
jgi:hypothetical protein